MRRSPLGHLVVAAQLLLGLAAAGEAGAQSIAGEYDVRVTGWNQMLGRDPARVRIDASTTLAVTQDGDGITVEFRTFASAMATTRLQGRVVDGSFVAILESSSGSDVSILGGLEGDDLVGDLIYTRAGANMVPGWLRVSFRATPRNGSPQPSSARPAVARPGALSRPVPRAGLAGRPSSDAPDREDEIFDVTVHAAADPEAPTTAQRVTLSARAVPGPGESVARTEIWLNGMLQRSTDGDVVDATLGPFEAGRTTWVVMAVSTDGGRSVMHEQTLQVRAAGRSIVEGRITGAGVDRVADVQLLTSGGLVAARAVPSGDGRYRFTQVPAGRYSIFVNDGKAELRVSPSSTVELSVDGRGRYTRDFQAR